MKMDLLMKNRNYSLLFEHTLLGDTDSYHDHMIVFFFFFFQHAISVTDIIKQDTKMFWLNFVDIYWKTTLPPRKNTTHNKIYGALY